MNADSSFRNDYDYTSAVKESIIDYVRENDYDLSGEVLDIVYRMQEDYDLRCNATGNDVGSYTCCTAEAADYVYSPANVEILAEALDYFCFEVDSYKKALTDPEFADVIVREYVYDKVLEDVAKFFIESRAEA